MPMARYNHHQEVVLNIVVKSVVLIVPILLECLNGCVDRQLISGLSALDRELTIRFDLVDQSNQDVALRSAFTFCLEILGRDGEMSLLSVIVDSHLVNFILSHVFSVILLSWINKSLVYGDYFGIKLVEFSHTHPNNKIEGIQLSSCIFEVPD